VLKRYEYTPKLEFEKDTPVAVQEMLRGLERERLAQRAAAAAAAAAAGHGAEL
jgi:hypothetical protein